MSRSQGGPSVEREQTRLSIILPMLNEAENIPPVLGDVFRTLDAMGESYEVIAVDDAAPTGPSRPCNRSPTRGSRCFAFAGDSGRRPRCRQGSSMHRVRS